MKPQTIGLNTAMLLFVCFGCFLLSSSVEATFGERANDNVIDALQQIGIAWGGNSVRYWKCAIENRSSQTLYALGSTSDQGYLATPLYNIPPGSTGSFVWDKAANSATGASGVVHYQYGNKVLNLMAYIPYDWNLHHAWCNARVSYSKESFYNLYQGKGGCVYPTRAGSWGQVDGAVFYLTDRSQAEFKVYFMG